jgi:hypothetical protein
MALTEQYRRNGTDRANTGGMALIEQIHKGMALTEQITQKEWH